MGHPFSHPKGKELLKRVADLFRSASAYISEHSHIAFVCGGSIRKDSLRRRFCAYSREALPNLRVFLAEVAQKDLLSNNEPSFYPITEFEQLISEVADCIVLFPESPGSYSELGFFANIPTVRAKLLVANDASLQGQDSFISLGPIHLIDSHSHFKPTIQLDTQNPNFELIKSRLEQRIPSRNRRKFYFQPHPNIDAKERFFCIFEIVRLFPFLDLEGVVFAYKSIFRNAKPTEIKQFISILVAAEYLQRKGSDSELFYANDAIPPFLDFENFDHTTFRLEVYDHYRSNFPLLTSFIDGSEQ